MNGADSRFLSRATAALNAYVPGEQPQDKRYIKLNTNENPYPPSPKVLEALRGFPGESLRLYPDPDNGDFTCKLAEFYGLDPERVLVCGGSDEALAFAFMAFFNRGDPVCFADITYGFYRVYADLFQLEAKEIPLRDDFTLHVEDYYDAAGHIFMANPNAPTGLTLAPQEIEALLRRDPNRLVVVDEAYGNFAPGSSCLGLLGRYDNLLVIRTFSKSWALAGMRLGAAFGQRGLIDGLRRIKFSFNPYNLDRVSSAVGLAAIQDREYLADITNRVIVTRQRSRERLERLGFRALPSGSNFLFASHPKLSGETLYRQLKEDGVLVRHFAKPRIKDFVRVTIGTEEEMESLFQILEDYV